MTRYVLLSAVMMGSFAGASALISGFRSACLKKQVDRDADEAMALLKRAGIVK